MKRYQKANEGIHAPEELKENAARPSQKRTYSRWTAAVAAVLVAAIIGGIALWPKRGGEPAVLSNEHPENSIQPRTDPGVGGVEDSPGRSVPTYGAYGDGSHKALALSEAVYQLPEVEVPPMPTWSDFHSDGEDEEAWQRAEDAWQEALEARRRIVFAAQYKLAENTSIRDFVTASTAQFLAGAGENNRVYSPLNLYMALAMLAETAGGDSRQQILDALGADSIETLREDAAIVWQNYYQDDDMGTSVMANSLWLRDDMGYSQDTLDTLAANYYASSFAGEMGSEQYDQALRDWVNEQTRGVLAQQADGLSFDPATVLGLVSTLYFKFAWSSPFSAELNTRDVFHSPSGDVEAEFLHREIWYGDYYWGEHFSAISLGFQGSGYRMWLILPDEGYAADKLAAGGEAMEFLLADKSYTYDDDDERVAAGWPDQTSVRINLSLPKFDVSDHLGLADGLKALGITDVFDSNLSNFDPLGAGTDVPICVGKAQHAARVMIDEEGCTAASYVDLMLCGAAMPPEEIVDFTLDRPFLFAITGNSDLPLFLGVVNQPNG